MPLSGRWDSRCRLGHLSWCRGMWGLGTCLCFCIDVMRKVLYDRGVTGQPDSPQGLCALCTYHYGKGTNHPPPNAVEGLRGQGVGVRGGEELTLFTASGPTYGHSNHTVHTV